jgi:hypothetical protein
LQHVLEQLIQQRHAEQYHQAMASASAAAPAAAESATQLIKSTDIHVHLNNLQEAVQFAAWIAAVHAIASPKESQDACLDNSSSSSSTYSSNSNSRDTAANLQQMRSFAVHGRSPLEWPTGRQQAAAAAAAVPGLQLACSQALSHTPNLQHLELQQLSFGTDVFIRFTTPLHVQLACQRSGYKLPEVPVTAAAPAAACLQQLTSLSLQYCSLGTTDLPLLLRQLPALQQLNLSGLALGPAVWQQYSGQVLRSACVAIAGMTGLTALDLSGLEICDAELQVCVTCIHLLSVIFTLKGLMTALGRSCELQVCVQLAVPL